MDVFKDAARSVVQTMAATFTFAGRARIIDVVWYWLASMVVGALVSFAAEALPWNQAWFAGRTADIVLIFPIFALFARRLHDQGLSGWWTLLLLPFPPINLYQSYRVVFAVQNPHWLHEPNPVGSWFPWLFAVMLGIIILLLRPGQHGSNRYGPDPRDTAQPEP